MDTLTLEERPGLVGTLFFLPQKERGMPTTTVCRAYSARMREGTRYPFRTQLGPSIALSRHPGEGEDSSLSSVNLVICDLWQDRTHSTLPPFPRGACLGRDGAPISIHHNPPFDGATYPRSGRFHLAAAVYFLCFVGRCPISRVPD